MAYVMHNDVTDYIREQALHSMVSITALRTVSLVAQCILHGKIPKLSIFFQIPQKSQDHTVKGGPYTHKVLSKPYFSLS